MRVSVSYRHNLELSVCLSLITAKPLEINDINVTEGGISSSQISFLNLITKISNGATFDINDTGCRLRVIPGTLIGGEIEHDCDSKEALGYYAMGLILLAPFCQKPIEAKLWGITNLEGSLSIEYLNYSLSETLKDVIGLASMFEMVVKQRGAYPDGGGLAEFRARPVKSLGPLDKQSMGRVQKVRGLAWTTRVNPTLGKRIIDGSKKGLSGLLSDIYLTEDHRKGKEAGNSPGFGAILSATTTEGTCIAVEVIADGNTVETSESIGARAASQLGRHIIRGGIVAPAIEPLLLSMLAVSRRDVSKIVLGVPSQETIQALRDIKMFTGVKFNIEPVKSGMKGYRGPAANQILLYSCVGCGIVNLNRAIR